MDQLESKILQIEASVYENGQGLLNEVLIELSTNQEKQNQKQKYLTILYKMIAQTRDIYGGKGEYAKAYMMIWTWYKYYPELAMYALSLFVLNPPVEEDTSNGSKNVEGETDKYYINKDTAPYGSWKDIKYLCHYAAQQGVERDVDASRSSATKLRRRAQLSRRCLQIDHPLIQYCIELANFQLKQDHGQDQDKTGQDKTGQSAMSLVAKWIPRETSPKFGWLCEEFAINYFKEYIESAETPASLTKAVKKCKTHYRQLLANLNRQLDTIQIKQAGARWAEIDHAKTSATTMKKQKNALMNIARNSKTGKTVRSVDEDRIQCAKNYMGYRGCNLAEGDIEKQGPPNLEYSILERAGDGSRRSSHKTWKDLLYALNNDRYLPMEIAISGYI